MTQERVDPLGRNPGSGGIERQQRRGQRGASAGASAYRCIVGIQLGQIRIPAKQRLQCGNEEQGLAEDSAARQAQRIPHSPMMVLMSQHGVELCFAEEVQSGLGDVHPGAKVAGAESLWMRVRDYANPGVVTQMTDYLEPSEQPAVGAALAECSP